MRIHGDPKRAAQNLTAGRERARRARREFLGAPLRPPPEGTLLRTITITDHIAGRSVRYEIRQARRRNQIIPTCMGQRFFKRPACGWDFLLRKLRAKLMCRWLITP